METPESPKPTTHLGYLNSHLLIAMPTIMDPRFEKTVIFMVKHSEQGAMGLVINKLADSIDFTELLAQLDIDTESVENEVPIHAGGPVETGLGFVLHSNEYQQSQTIDIDGVFSLTTSVDILKAIAQGDGPNKSIFALGYASWAPGQLDQEIQSNGWLHVPADEELVFNCDIDAVWDRAVRKMGIDPSFLSVEAGHA